jgi:hypothetical protein
MRRLIVPTVLAFVGLSVAFALLRSGARRIVPAGRFVPAPHFFRPRVPTRWC